MKSASWPIPPAAGRILTLLVLAGALAAPPARAARLDGAAALRLDPRLAALTASDLPVSAWVTFADKGERDPGELAEMLARAEAALTPENRARRIRAGLHPLVSYDDLPVFAPYLEDLRARGLAPYGASRWGNEVAVSVPGTRLAELASLAHVARLRPVELARVPAPEPAAETFVPPAPRVAADRALAAQSLSYGRTWTQLNQIRVPAVHDSGYIGTGVKICVLDNGFNFHTKHEATRNALVPPGHERDFVQGDTVATDTVIAPASYQHGMWTFGCMAGNLPGQYVGAAPGATYALGRTEENAFERLVELVWWRMGAEWADSLGADVISSSLGYSAMDTAANSLTYALRDGHTTIITRAAEIAASKGILVVTAAGNDHGLYPYPEDKVSAPGDANGDSVITVGAVDLLGNLAGFSSWGPTVDGRIKPDLVARGVSDSLVNAGSDPNTYTTRSGTSFSTPIVAGLAACLVQARPTWSATTIIQALYQTASRTTHPDSLYGRGLPDGLAALRWQPNPAVVPPTLAPPGWVALALEGAHPAEPGRTATRVSITLGADAPERARVRAFVFDTQGRAVGTLWSGVLRRGESHREPWRGLDADGRVLRSGVYFVSVEVAGRTSTLRLVSLR